MSKVTTLETVVSPVFGGATIMFGGFLGVGAPLRCIEYIARITDAAFTVSAGLCAYRTA